MAKVSIQVDTDEKTLSVKAGDSNLENVSYISISRDNDYFYLDIEQFEEMDDGLKKRTCLYARGSEQEWKEKPDEVDYKGIAEVLLQRSID